MKVIRVPWIQCRADEASAERYPISWQGSEFGLLAYSETEARQWWEGLSDRAKRELLGISGSADDEPSLF